MVVTVQWVQDQRMLRFLQVMSQTTQKNGWFRGRAP